MDNSPHKSSFLNVNGLRIHYLDWGGDGPALVFLPGMGCSAHIFDGFAPRFTDRFHVVAITRRGHGESDAPEIGYDLDTLTEDLRQCLDALQLDQVILAGHSMANLELCHFTAIYPERVLKLIFFDATYERTKFGELESQNPMNEIKMPEGLSAVHNQWESLFDYIKAVRPDLADIWSEPVESDIRACAAVTADGRITEKMTEAIAGALIGSLFSYVPETTNIRVPTLSFYSIWDDYGLSMPAFLTDEQKKSIIEHIDTRMIPHQREQIERFRREVPHARVIEIPRGHHYCFIKHEALVYEEMRAFLM
jgi:pimeloyl-ACP methyl ester carboxylesterase